MQILVGGTTCRSKPYWTFFYRMQQMRRCNEKGEESEDHNCCDFHAPNKGSSTGSCMVNEETFRIFLLERMSELLRGGENGWLTWFLWGNLWGRRDRTDLDSSQGYCRSDGR